MPTNHLTHVAKILDKPLVAQIVDDDGEKKEWVADNNGKPLTKEFKKIRLAKGLFAEARLHKGTFSDFIKYGLVAVEIEDEHFFKYGLFSILDNKWYFNPNSKNPKYAIDMDIEPKDLLKVVEFENNLPEMEKYNIIIKNQKRVFYKKTVKRYIDAYFWGKILLDRAKTNEYLTEYKNEDKDKDKFAEPGEENQDAEGIIEGKHNGNVIVTVTF